MRVIEVETSVFSEIWKNRQPPEENENEILLRILSEYQIFKGLEFSRKESLKVKEVKTSLQTSKTSSRHGFAHNAKREETMISGKIRWVDDIRAVLVELGGEASLHQIYKGTKERREGAGRSTPASIEATIRRTLEDHCKESANYRGVNLFKMPQGHGAGIWALAD